MITSQNEFHPMRGHVEHDGKVVMNDGKVFTIKSHMIGWVLINEDGSVYGYPVDSASALTDLIVGYGE